MSIDLSFLSSDTLLYFLTHSTVFVVATASAFFTFGLAFGWLTWARYKWQRKELMSECESLKDEIATLKRKLAEQSARASTLVDASVQALEQSLRPAHSEPDPVINSFLTTAAQILPRHEEPETPVTTPAGGNPGSNAEPDATAERPPSHRKPSVTSGVKPKKKTLPSLIPPDADRDFVHQAGGSLASPQTADAPSTPVSDHEVQPVSASPVPETPVAEPEDKSGSRLVSDPHLGLVYASRPGLSDDLSHLKGVASVIEGKLNDYGVYTFKQIALWSEENIREFSALLAFKDRIHREQWVEQARELHYQKYGERL